MLGFILSWWILVWNLRARVWSDIDPPGAETGIFRENQSNTCIFAADVLATIVGSTSAAMLLTIRDKLFAVFHEERFQLPVSSQYREMREIANIFVFPKENSAQ